MKDLLRGQKLLSVYAGVLTLGVTAALLSGFTAGNTNATFDTITVQRINVVEPDGTLRMVVSNNHRIPGIIFKGHEYADFTGRKTSTEAGLVFYDAQATESGGLTFGGRMDAQGAISRFGHLSFDRYNQDQMLTIDARDDGTNFGAAIKMLDVPSWSLEEYLQLLESIKDLPQDQQQAAINEFLKTHPAGGAVRALLGNENTPSSPADSRSLLNLRDSSNRDRARLRVDSTGEPALEFLDANGTVTHRYPPN
jgi:hypothetical protein